MSRGEEEQGSREDWRAPNENECRRGWKIGNLSPPAKRTRAPANRRTAAQPLAVSIRLQHETETKHSGTRGHTVETPSNGHARNRYEANEGKTKPHNTHNC